MFHWPILSAIIGIGTNLFFLALISILSYLHFAMEEEDKEENFIYEKGESEEEKDIKTLSDSKIMNAFFLLFSILLFQCQIIMFLSISFIVSSDSSSLEDVPALEDIPKPQKEAHLSHSSDPILGEPSYIQEISTLIAESSDVELTT